MSRDVLTVCAWGEWNAEDEAKITGVGEPTRVPAGTFDDTVTILDRNPLDGSSGEKVYARGIGLIVDGAAQLTRIETSSP